MALDRLSWWYFREALNALSTELSTVFVENLFFYINQWLIAKLRIAGLVTARVTPLVCIPTRAVVAQELVYSNQTRP